MPNGRESRELFAGPKTSTTEVGVFLRVSLVTASELVHRFVFTRRFEGRFAAEILLVVVADVRAGHFLALYQAMP
jgi:hypothetical protein